MSLNYKEKAYNGTHDDLKKFVGKRVSLMHKGEKRVGVLTWANVGLLHNEFQVTLNRTPLWPVDMSTIKLEPRRKPLFEK